MKFLFQTERITEQIIKNIFSVLEFKNLYLFLSLSSCMVFLVEGLLGKRIFERQRI